jgi:hypothetical protein
VRVRGHFSDASDAQSIAARHDRDDGPGLPCDVSLPPRRHVRKSAISIPLDDGLATSFRTPTEPPLSSPSVVYGRPLRVLLGRTMPHSVCDHALQWYRR